MNLRNFMNLRKPLPPDRSMPPDRTPLYLLVDRDGDLKAGGFQSLYSTADVAQFDRESHNAMYPKQAPWHLIVVSFDMSEFRAFAQRDTAVYDATGRYP